MLPDQSCDWEGVGGQSAKRPGFIFLLHLVGKLCKTTPLASTSCAGAVTSSPREMERSYQLTFINAAGACRPP